MKTKTTLKFGIFMLAIAFMPLVSCSDDDSSKPSGGGGTGGGGNGNIPAESMSMKVDGSPKTFEIVSGFSSFSGIALSGSDTSSAYPTVSIGLNDTIIAGTYTLPSQNLYPSFSYSQDSTNIFFTTSGALTIISHDTTKQQIIGTFDVTLTKFGSPSKVELTEGKFNIEY